MSVEVKKKYNTTIAPLWKTSTGGFYMGKLTVNDEMLDALKTVTKGGQFLIKINKFGKNERSPAAYLEYVAEQDVSEFLNRPKNNNVDI